MFGGRNIQKRSRTIRDQEKHVRKPGNHGKPFRTTRLDIRNGCEAVAVRMCRPTSRSTCCAPLTGYLRVILDLLSHMASPGWTCFPGRDHGLDAFNGQSSQHLDCNYPKVKSTGARYGMGNCAVDKSRARWIRGRA